jgi:UDP-GlcNAc:undecaprenyl-phosphate/decaprenyl-phosphate GlcNAc-1-phosphate transferase
VSSNPHYLLIFLASLVLAFLGTPLVRHFALRLQAIDNPDDRRVHQTPTPLLGGVAIFTAALAGLLLIKFFQGPARGILIGAVVILVLGIWDDLYHLSPKLKLLGQILAAASLLPFRVMVETTGIFWLDCLITVFWVVAICNAFNLLDNMDGLSAGIAALAALGFFIIGRHSGQVIIAGASLAIAGACLGFLPYNFGPRPARIFMGDTGSLFLGYLLAVLAVRLVYDSPHWLTPLVPLIILAVPIIDTSFVSIARTLEGRSIAQGGKDHLSHRLVAAFGLSRQGAVALLWLGGATAGGLGILLVKRDLLSALAGAGTLVIFMAIMAYQMREKKNGGKTD